MPQNPVGEGGFPHVGLADQSHLFRLGLLLALLIGLEIFDDFVQQVSQAQALGRRNAVDVANAQGVKVVKSLLVRLGLRLVYHHDDRLRRTPQHVRNLFVCGHQPVLCVHKEQNHVCRVNGKLRLVFHVAQDDILSPGLDAARVNQGEFIVEPFRILKDAVPGHAGRVLHNGDSLLANSVEKCGFPHIGPSYNGHQRLCHALPSLGP